MAADPGAGEGAGAAPEDQPDFAALRELLAAGYVKSGGNGTFDLYLPAGR